MRDVVKIIKIFVRTFIRARILKQLTESYSTSAHIPIPNSTPNTMNRSIEYCKKQHSYAINEKYYSRF